MKTKLIIAFVAVLSLTTACRVTKTVTMVYAKKRAAKTEQQFMIGKEAPVAFLNFTPEQKAQVENVWRTEKAELSKIELKNELIAPIIYKSELAFRAALTSEQLSKYLALWATGSGQLDAYYLDDNMMAEIKRIYIDK